MLKHWSSSTAKYHALKSASYGAVLAPTEVSARLPVVSNHPLRELVDRIASEKRTWVRAAAVRYEEQWRLALLDVTLGAAPTGWKRSRWRYPSAVFAAWSPNGTTVARWFSSGKLDVGGTSVAFAPEDGVTRDWRESRASGIYEPLEWPSMVWTVRTSQVGAIALHGELVAREAPAFLSFDEAARALLCVPRLPNRHFNSVEVVVREQMVAGRIDSVTIRPAEIVVEVAGDGLRGADLMLGGAQGRSKRLNSKATRVRLAMAEPPGPGAWVLLRRGDELIDRRVLDPASRQHNVHAEVDLATEVQVIISRGEGADVEFKRQLPDGNPQGPMKTISAFANGDGGVIIFGVDDEGQIVGLQDQYLRSAVDRVSTLIGDWTRPPVVCTPQLVEIGGASLVVVFVPAGREPPYAVGTSDHKLTYYVRRGATSAPARPSDIRAAVRSRMPSSAEGR